MENTNKSLRVGTFLMVCPTPDQVRLNNAILKELDRSVNVLYFHPHNKPDNSMWIKVIGLDGAVYPLLNRNGEVKLGCIAVSINTALDRLEQGLPLFPK